MVCITKCTKMSHCIVLSLFLHATLLKHITYCVGQKYRQNGSGCSYNPRTSLSLVRVTKMASLRDYCRCSNQKSAFCHTPRSCNTCRLCSSDEGPLFYEERRRDDRFDIFLVAGMVLRPFIDDKTLLVV